jgi:MFS family permease
MYYVHERGIRVALLTACYSGVANLPATLSGLTTEKLGWRWLFWLTAIFLGVLIVLAFFFGWETAYNRDAIYNTDIGSLNVCPH